MPPSPAEPAIVSPSGTSLEGQLRDASTALYERSKELKQKNEELNTLSTELTEANARLGELDKLKSNLLELATHRLRGPLASIRGYASMMAEGDFDANPQMLKDASTKISTSSADMETMIDEFLVASSLASNAVHFNLTAFDVGGALRGVLAKLIPVATQKHVEIKTETAPESLIVNGDPDYLNRVFSIVIDNAIRYTPDKGSITVRLGLSEDKSKILFEVNDTGIGMTPDIVSKLFSQFLRAENAFKVWVFGNGLGLYIAKQIVDAHHGTIHASSNGEGKGSTFVVELPTVSASSSPSQ